MNDIVSNLELMTVNSNKAMNVTSIKYRIREFMKVDVARKANEKGEKFSEYVFQTSSKGLKGKTHSSNYIQFLIVS